MTHDPNTTDPRLLDSSATDFESSLLKAAIVEAPTQELSAKMLMPLATGAAVATAAGGAKLLKGAAAKWLGTGATILAVGGAYYLGTTPGDVPPESKPPAPPSIVEAVPADPDVGPSDESTPQAPPTGGEETVVDVPPRAVGPAPSLGKKSPSTLAEEMQLLDRARAALKSRKDPEEALRLLNTYEHKYPRGALRQEATVLRVSALEESGARDRADALKSEFLKDNPKSAHKKQLENGSSLAK